MRELVLSALPHTWLLDLDGTLLLHNGYKRENGDQTLPHARELMEQIPRDDFIIILTSRSREEAEKTEQFLTMNAIRYDVIIYGLPFGERILINDIKPGGLRTALALNLERDQGPLLNLRIDGSL